MNYVIALIHEEDGVFGVSFPDFPGCVGVGSSPDEALTKGGQVLALHVAGMTEDGESIPHLAAPEKCALIRNSPIGSRMRRSP